MNSSLDKANLMDIYRILHPKSTGYSFISAPHHTYTKIDHIIGSKSLLSKCKRMEIITKQSLRPQCNQVRTQNLETNSELHNFMETEQMYFAC